MTTQTIPEVSLPERAIVREPAGWNRWLRSTENSILVFALAMMVLLPLAEMAVRRGLGASISGVNSFVQHGTLLVAMVGGAIAARERRLLSLASAAAFLRGWPRKLARAFTHAVAASVTVCLAKASVEFLLVEKAVGQEIAYGVPVWLLEIFLPVGYALIAVRVFWHAAEQWRWRLVAGALTGLLVSLAVQPPLPPGEMVVPFLVVLFVAAVLGAPIYVVLGGAALILFWGGDRPIAAVALENYLLVTNHTLPAIPLFTLAGYFLAEGGASQRLVRLFGALVGHFRGGPAVLVALVCAFFTSFTGASGVTILALGGLLMPVLLAARYSEKTALGLLTGTGSLGLLFPPCLPLILYAVIAEVDMVTMFLGGLVPGLLLVGMTAAWGVSQAPRDFALRRFRLSEVRQAAWEAKWELLVPVVALGGIFSGLATPMESAALTAFYAFVTETFIYRDLKLFRDTPRVVTECGLLVGGILLILGVALGFTHYLVDAQIPDRVVEWVTGSIQSPWVFLLALNLFLIVVGALVDIYSAIVIIVPLIVPIGRAFGVDPVHLGIIFLVNAELGYLMPPVGENLFIASYRFDKPVVEVFRSVIPMVLVFLVAVVLVTYIPTLTLWLPQLLGR